VIIHSSPEIEKRCPVCHPKLEAVFGSALDVSPYRFAPSGYRESTMAARQLALGQENLRQHQMLIGSMFGWWRK